MARGVGVLDDAPVVEDGDDVGQRERLFLVVRDEHHGRAERGEQLLDLERAGCRAGSASSAANGSSSRIRRGSGASARATATRCCWPPESSCGPAMAEAAEPDELEQVGHAPPAALAARQPEADVLGDAEVREEQALLRARSRSAGGARGRAACPSSNVSPLSAMRPRSGWSKPAIRRSSVVLPEPEGPRTAAKPPAGTVRSTSLSTAVEP